LSHSSTSAGLALAACGSICAALPAVAQANSSNASSAATTPAPPTTLKLKGGTPLQVDLRADRLTYRPVASCTGRCPVTLSLRGAVEVVVVGDLGEAVGGSHRLVLRAQRLQVDLDKSGSPRRMRANGAVRLAVGERSGRARQLVVALDPYQVRLHGDAVLRCPDLGVVLSGERIEVALPSGAVSVHRARAELTAVRVR